MELAMTFKAVFLNFGPAAGRDGGVLAAPRGSFGLQLTDFSRRCQRFAGYIRRRFQVEMALFCWASAGQLKHFASRRRTCRYHPANRAVWPLDRPGAMDKVIQFRHEGPLEQAFRRGNRESRTNPMTSTDSFHVATGTRRR
jgi:hypothetical protein